VRYGFSSLFLFDRKHCKIGRNQAADAGPAANPKTAEANNAAPPSIITPSSQSRLSLRQISRRKARPEADACSLLPPANAVIA
jgi:hypothetical protein